MIQSDNLRGAALMCASMAAFTVNDACLKALSDEVPLFQALFFRGLATSLVMAVLARTLGMWRLRLPRRDIGRIGLRTLSEIAAAWLFLTALFNMPLANATAILQVLPLAVTLGGALFFGEAVGWRRLSAILVGFAGVMLIVRPGAEGFTIYSLYALAAVVAVTVRDLATRSMSRETPSLMVALAGAVGVTTAAGIASLTAPWVPLSLVAWAQLAGAIVSIVGAYVFSVAAMRQGEIAAVTPFRYTGLLFALLIGFAAFGEWPDPLTLLGAGIVVATGLYSWQRERRRARGGC